MILIVTFVLVIFGCRKEQNQSPIAFINIRNFDRAQLALLFQKADGAKPKLILLDLWFPEESDTMSDSILSNALLNMQSNLIYSHRFENVEIAGKDSESGKDITRTLDQFMKTGSASGHVTTFGVPVKGKMVSKSYPAFIHSLDQEDTSIHVSLLCAYALDSLKAARFISDHPNEIDLDLDQDRIDQYDRIDEDWNNLLSDDWSGLKDRVVIFGYIGPTTEDKKYTMLNDNGYSSPDTYGPFILAEIISTVLAYP